MLYRASPPSIPSTSGTEGRASKILARSTGQNCDALKLRARPLLIVALIYLLARLPAWELGIRPDVSNLNWWQYLDVNLLQNDLGRSLFYQHSQPPLWNLIIAAMLKIAGGEPEIFVSYYTAFSAALSITIAFLVFAMVSYLLSETEAWIASAVYILFGGSLFYENIIFYQLFCAFLATLAVYAVLRGSIACGALEARLMAWTFFGAILALTLTWTLFHPLTVPLSGLLFFRFLRNRGAGIASLRRREPLLIMMLFSILAFAVPLKNYFLFGSFSTGSWLGLNLAQVAPVKDENFDWRMCDFRENQYLEGEETSFGFNHPALLNVIKSGGWHNYNHFSLLERSKKCSKVSLDSIKRHPVDFLLRRARTFLASNLSLSDGYFLTPQNWDKVSGIITLRNMLFIPVILEGQQFYIAPALALLLCTTIALTAVYRINDLPPAYTSAALVSFAFIAWVQMASHAFNGGEQARMRFTVEPLYIVTLALGFGIKKSLGSRPPSNPPDR